MNKEMESLLNECDKLEKEQREIYVASITNLNNRYRELLKNDLGNELVQNCARDAADELVRRFFDTSDYYITPIQMWERIVHFEYDNEPDPLNAYNDQIRKDMYNMNDSPRSSATLQSISENCMNAQQKLFTKEEYIDSNGQRKTRYKDSKLMEAGKKAYREQKREDEGGTLHDELSGISEEEARLEVDHVQSASKASINSRYLHTPEAQQAMKEFYNSKDNFQMLDKSANGSKGDVSVFECNGKTYTQSEKQALEKTMVNDRKAELIEGGMSKEEAKAQAKEEVSGKFEDITFKASAKQVADSVCDRWENANEATKKELQRTGKLGPDGKVPADVKKQLEKELRASMNAESKVILKHMDYAKVSEDALDETKKGLSKIIIGQVVYYVLPPMVFETKKLVRIKGMTIDRFFKEIKAGGRRIVNYVSSKLGDIFKAIIGNGFKKFIKSFFDIIIETVKETVKRLVKVAKELVLSLVQCVKIIASKTSSAAEKADAVTKTLAATITTVVLEILFEYLEKQFGLPDILMEPLQIIVNIIAVNLIMLILQKADLFDVRYGLLLSNIDKAFQEEYEVFRTQSNQLRNETEKRINDAIENIETQLATMRENIVHLDFYRDDAATELNKLNEIYNMGIDFNKEWAEFNVV